MKDELLLSKPILQDLNTPSSIDLLGSLFIEHLFLSHPMVTFDSPILWDWLETTDTKYNVSCACLILASAEPGIKQLKFPITASNENYVALFSVVIQKMPNNHIFWVSHRSSMTLSI